MKAGDLFFWHLCLQPFFWFLWAFYGGASGKPRPPHDSYARMGLAVIVALPTILAILLYKAIHSVGFSLGSLLRAMSKGV